MKNKSPTSCGGGPISFLSKLLPSLRCRTSIEFTAQEKARWNEWEIFGLVLFGAFSLLFLYPVFQGLHDVHAWLHPASHAGELVLRPTPGFLLISMFLCIVPGALATNLLMSVLSGREDYRRYTAYYSQRYRMDYDRNAYALCMAVLVPGLLLATILMNAWMRVGPEHVEFNSVFQLCATRYGYDQVVQVTKFNSFRTPSGEIIEDTYCEVTFTDGKKWSGLSSVLAPPYSAQPGVAPLLIAERAGIEITDGHDQRQPSQETVKLTQ